MSRLPDIGRRDLPVSMQERIGTRMARLPKQNVKRIRLSSQLEEDATRRKPKYANTSNTLRIVGRNRTQSVRRTADTQ